MLQHTAEQAALLLSATILPCCVTHSWRSMHNQSLCHVMLVNDSPWPLTCNAITEYPHERCLQADPSVTPGRMMGVEQTWKKIISVSWQAKYSTAQRHSISENRRAVWTTSKQMKEQERQSEILKDRQKSKEMEDTEREGGRAWCETKIVCEEKCHRTWRLKEETEVEPCKQKAETPLRSRSL